MRARGWSVLATYASVFDAGVAMAQLESAMIPTVRDSNCRRNSASRVGAPASYSLSGCASATLRSAMAVGRPPGTIVSRPYYNVSG